MEEVVIVGGGAAGLACAVLLNKASVTILEKNDKVGKKLLATGNGRCNLTNEKLLPENFHSHYKKSFFAPISAFGYEQTIEFFENLGIVPISENAKIFPASEQASSVLDVLRIAVNAAEVDVVTNAAVVDIKYKKGHFALKTIDGKVYTAAKVVIATGGLAGVKEDYTIYKVLEKLGHKIEPLLPTLVHIKSNTVYCKMLQGTRVKAKVTAGDKTEYGEVLFTEDGLSGPAIFNISRQISNALTTEITLDLVKDLTEEEVIAMIYSRIAKNPHHTVAEMFLGWQNKKVAISIIKAADLGKATRSVDTLEYEEVENLAKTMKSLKFAITGTRSFKFAQATIGGVSLEDIDIATMESKKIKGLYFMGEVVDVDGDCGGYNLQWAWSTAAAVARSIYSS
ncbi:NAD(P)/FAD-dependent oxidoreductase [Candidatus Epulonipiscium viviparus]|uniref:NAD(P)/FAD-dependent oxidoreductase n=1 Tax=Candidatus Epulonipiscium viviparus TaxID=420336 RepID=UPI0027380CF6|nr:aminoacetone oxidase family FAD-binding enzyme [Candidatus Epulopiscium viviparus]